MRLDSFWDAALASLAPVVVGFFIARTETVRNWWAARKDAKEARKNVPTAIREIAESLRGLTESDERRTKQYVTISTKLDQHTATLESQNKSLADVAAVAYGQMDQDPNPRFICDSDGSNRMVNTAFARLVQCGRDELMQFKYQQFVPAALNPHFVDGFKVASANHRTYEVESIFVRPDDTMFYARVRYVPHPEDNPPATHWNGTVRYLREYTQ